MEDHGRNIDRRLGPIPKADPELQKELIVGPNRVINSVPIEQRTETVNHPSHYGGDTVYEAIKVIEAWELGFNLGNTVKYISRAGKKPGAEEIEDLKKAAWYLDRRIKELEKRK